MKNEQNDDVMRLPVRITVRGVCAKCGGQGDVTLEYPAVASGHLDLRNVGTHIRCPKDF